MLIRQHDYCTGVPCTLSIIFIFIYLFFIVCPHRAGRFLKWVPELNKQQQKLKTLSWHCRVCTTHTHLSWDDDAVVPFLMWSCTNTANNNAGSPRQIFWTWVVIWAFVLKQSSTSSFGDTHFYIVWASSAVFVGDFPWLRCRATSGLAYTALQHFLNDSVLTGNVKIEWVVSVPV